MCLSESERKKYVNLLLFSVPFLSGSGRKDRASPPSCLLVKEGKFKCGGNEMKM